MTPMFVSSLRGGARRGPGGSAARPWARALALLAVVQLATTLAACTSLPRGAPLLAPEEYELHLPSREGSLRFAVIGDAGTGGTRQRQVAETMANYHDVFPFDFVLMVGDNLYGGEDPDDYRQKFEEPYSELLDDGVRFYAALGNHDERAQTNYELFNMDGRRYYEFAPEGHSARFYSLDSDYLDPDQVDWLRDRLAENEDLWEIAFFHHPLYSSGGRHGSDADIRRVLEPLFQEGGVDVVLSGHDHFYERIEPQGGILYFVTGSSGKLRPGDIRRSSISAAGFDSDNAFLLVEIVGAELHFQAVSRTGAAVDHGMFWAREAPPEARTAE